MSSCRPSHRSRLWCSSRRISWFFALLCICVVSGCNSVEIAQEVSQGDAIEIVSVLHEQGLTSKAVRSKARGTPSFAVTVSAEDYLRATRILHQRGLPRDSSISLNELLGQSGFLPPSKKLQERRLEYAAALELQQLLEEIPSVRGARVVVRQLDPSGRVQASAASIVLQVTPGAKVAEEKVLSLVKSVIPNLDVSRLQITMFEVDMAGLAVDAEQAPRLVSFVGIAKVAGDDYQRLTLILLLGTLAIAFAGAVIGYWFRGVELGARFGDSHLDSLPGDGREPPEALPGGQF